MVDETIGRSEAWLQQATKRLQDAVERCQDEASLQELAELNIDSLKAQSIWDLDTVLRVADALCCKVSVLVPWSLVDRAKVIEESRSNARRSGYWDSLAEAALKEVEP